MTKCTKRSWEHKADAKRALKQIHKHKPKQLELYLCPHCGLYHLARRRKVKARQRRRSS